MFRSDRHASRRAVPALVTLGGSALAALLVLAGCSFPGGEDNGSEDVATRLPPPSAPPAGVADPAADPQLARFYGQKLTWKDCGEEDQQCASFTVPLDWSKPAGATIKISALRNPAARNRIGSLVVNPGGPGASGKDYAAAARQAFGRAVIDHYDVVGFDPRGVGDSAPVKCLDDREFERYLAADGSPDTPQELTTALDLSRKFAAACQRNTGELLRHVDTRSVVRDMDVLREALGEGRLAFHGASYGTYIGAWYAEKFPWRVGRFVLDGAVDPSLTSEQYVAGQTQGFNRALRAFIQDCQSQDECPLRGSVSDGLSQLGLLVEAADADPLRTDAGRDLTQNLLVTGIAQGLYDKSFWPTLTIGLTNALSGDGTHLLKLADLYYQRDENGRYGQTFAANPAIFCLDVAEKRTPQQIEEDAEELGRRLPPLGTAFGWGAISCAEWPIEAVVPRQKLTAKGAAPILVLGTVNDPATPYEWAQGLASQLSSARLLTWEGDVHTAYNRGARCVDDAVEEYLLVGTLPQDGLRCR